MSYVESPAPGSTELDRVWGLRPRYYEIFMQDYSRSMERVDPVLIELCRLRMAMVIGSELDLSLRYQPAIAAGLTEDKIRALSGYAKSPLFSDRERCCLDFAELFVIQSSNIGDDEVANVQSVLGAEAFIYFAKALSVMDQLQRSCAAFHIQPGTVVPATMPQFQLAPLSH